MTPESHPTEGPPTAAAANVVLGGHTYERTLVHTHLIHIKEPLEPILDALVRPLLKTGDWVAMSE
ncbi:MAG: hypothetical protein ACLPSM_02400 [Acidimicrobiales bacterium]